MVLPNFLAWASRQFRDLEGVRIRSSAPPTISGVLGRAALLLSSSCLSPAAGSLPWETCRSPYTLFFSPKTGPGSWARALVPLASRTFSFHLLFPLIASAFLQPSDPLASSTVSVTRTLPGCVSLQLFVFLSSFWLC